MGVAEEGAAATQLAWVWQNRQVNQGVSPLGGLVGVALDRIGSDPRRTTSPLSGDLRTVLPAALAAHCRVGRMRAGRVTILVDCPTCLYELRARWSVALRQALGTMMLPVPVRDVWFRLDGG